MRVISRKTLREFWESRLEYGDAQTPLEAWYDEARKANWRDPADIKAQYRHASILKNNRVIFNIKGNRYRLVVRIDYAAALIFIRFVGTHAQYDAIDPEAI